MGSFTKGLLVGLGLSLLFAPKKGDEMRHLVAQRLQYLQGTPPENEELKQSVRQAKQSMQEVQQKAEQSSQLGSAARSTAQETATKAGEVQRDLNRVTRQEGTDGPSTRPRR